MEFVVVLMTLVCYGFAGYLWWREDAPHYTFVLLGGHVAALLSPLWVLVYGIVYSEGFGLVRLVFGQPLLRVVLLGSAWFYTLPALVVLFLYHRRWWFPGYLSGLLTYGVFLLYHLLIQLLGLRSGAWRYTPTAQLTPTVPPAFLGALMAALVSLGLLYTLLVTLRYSWLSLLLTLLPTTLLLSLVVHGLLGAPLWVPLLLRTPPWVAPTWVLGIGMLVTLALLAWAIHISAWGLERLEQRA